MGFGGLHCPLTAKRWLVGKPGMWSLPLWQLVLQNGDPFIVRIPLMLIWIIKKKNKTKQNTQQKCRRNCCWSIQIRQAHFYIIFGSHSWNDWLRVSLGDRGQGLFCGPPGQGCSEVSRPSLGHLPGPLRVWFTSLNPPTFPFLVNSLPFSGPQCCPL